MGKIQNIIDNIVLSESQQEVKLGESTTLTLRFKIIGNIREVFDHRNWERAYNKHDNIFRIKIEITLRSGGKRIYQSSDIRKASLFWTRNPKIPYRIWVLIIKDDTSFYPSTVEEVKSLLFDVEKKIEIKGNGLNLANEKIHARLKISWGKHSYTEACELTGESNRVELTCRK